VDRLSPVDVSGFSDAVQISAGQGRTCAVRATGELMCWGWNGTGAIGIGGTAPFPNQFAPTPVYSNVLQVSVGAAHTCARQVDGTALCWGNNNFGQVGNASTTLRSTPTTVIGISNVVDIAAGGDHSCAILGDGRVFCWGRNMEGQLGNGTTMSVQTPVQIGISAVDIELGIFHSCAVVATGDARCWGSGGSGQLGNGTLSSSTVPVSVTPLNVAGTNFRPLSVELGTYTSCGIFEGDRPGCWGLNDRGQLGNGSTGGNATAPGPLSNVTGALEIEVGIIHGCVRTASDVLCWGDNPDGQIGDGTMNRALVPTRVMFP
jgi:alpha-tubulin suppressor-like RCC1 family protein